MNYKPFVYAVRIFLENGYKPMAELAFGEGGNPTGETKIIPWDDIKERDKYIINAYTFVWDERGVVKTRSFDEYIDGHNKQPGKCDKTTEGVAINKTNFPDANFSEFVRQYDADGDGYLSDTELAAVTTMNCFGLGIADLKGIEYFTALTHLYCNVNKLTSLDVSGCTALLCLQCYGNYLTSLDVSGCTALKTLFCDGNQLTSLDVSHNTDLTWVICDSNYLTSLDVSAVPAIRDAVVNGTKDSSNPDVDYYRSEQSVLLVDKTVIIIYKP